MADGQDRADRMAEQWQRERPDLDPGPMAAVVRIKRASRLMERAARELFAEHGLQPWEFDILATLRRAAPPEGLTAGALAESAMVTAGAITNRIDRLVARELVTRRTDPAHRRSVLIALTDEGRRLVDATVGAHAAQEAALLGPLAPAEREQLSGLLRTLLVGLGDTPPDD